MEVQDSVLYKILFTRMLKKSKDSIRTKLNPKLYGCLSSLEYKDAVCNLRLTRRQARQILKELDKIGLITPLDRGFMIKDNGEQSMIRKIRKGMKGGLFITLGLLFIVLVLIVLLLGGSNIMKMFMFFGSWW